MRNYIVIFVAVVCWTSALSEACTTPQGVTSNCVSLYDCQPLLKAFEQRPLTSDVVSYLRQSQCGFDQYVPRVCCGPLPAQNNPPPTQSPPVTRAPNVQGGVDPVFDEDSYPAPRNDCGIDTEGDRIYGGQFTDLDEFPWMALLGYRTPTGRTTYQCGGVLINRRYVLTAAHCITGEIERAVGILYTARLGEYDTQTSIDCVKDDCADPPQDIAVQAGYPHQGYTDKNRNRRDDIGLVRLARRVTLTYYVKPICLVDSSQRLSAGDNVYVAGWGQTLSGKNSPIKQKLKLPIFDKGNCAAKFRTLGAELNEKQLCAGGAFAEDTCRGDSGGPLMKMRSEGIWETIGIVSFGSGCGKDGWPGVYTSVAAYTDWIVSTLRSTNA